MGKTNIQWTEYSWNIARGCRKVDSDCKNCYMYRDALWNNETQKGRHNPMLVQRTKTVFNLPLKIKEPSKFFVSSLTDFFIEEIDAYRHEAWDIIRRCPHHIFQILTKRPERIKAHLPPDWGEGWGHVWLGTSVGSQASIGRAKDLILSSKAKVKFLSVEPLHGPVDLREHLFNSRLLRGVSFENRTRLIEMVDWVVVGGESGNDNGKFKYRTCELEWIETIVEQCKDAGIPVFVKQLGTHLSKQLNLKNRHGGDMDEWPETINHLKIRQFPCYEHPALKTIL